MPLPEIEGDAGLAGLLPTSAAALAGIRTPLSGVSVTGGAGPEIAIILSAANGVLYADPAPGGAVGGGGSNTIWIAGSAAQVNAKLATLAYLSNRVGADVIAVSVVDSLGHSSRVSLPVQVLPLSTGLPSSGGTVGITGGTLTLEARTLDGLTLNIAERRDSLSSASLVLVNSTLGTRTHLNVVDENGPAGLAPRLAIAGQVRNEGLASLGGGPTLVTLANAATLTNTGRIEFVGSSAQIRGAGTLRNDGILAFTGSAANSPVIAVASAGTGVISLGAGATLELAQSVAAGQTIRFEHAPGQVRTLQLDQPRDVQAQIAGFAQGDQILLANTRYDAAAYNQAGPASGTLTLYDGATVGASLRFAGSYQLSSFDLLSTQLGSGAPAIRISLAASSWQAAQLSDHVGLPVYRFFDQALGTQMITQDAGERDAILATRPDLAYEGVGLRALDPLAPDSDAAPVFRFFESAHGTHFFTASGAEKDSILATRPDLIFEPGSTLLEHATPQPGDVPVFRFFDSTHGTHLYTADAGERASIMSARLELKDEGVAFYAPGW